MYWLVPKLWSDDENAHDVFCYSLFSLMYTDLSPHETHVVSPKSCVTLSSLRYCCVSQMGNVYNYLLVPRVWSYVVQFCLQGARAFRCCCKFGLQPRTYGISHFNNTGVRSSDGFQWQYVWQSQCKCNHCCQYRWNQIRFLTIHDSFGFCVHSRNRLFCIRRTFRDTVQNLVSRSDLSCSVCAQGYGLPRIVYLTRFIVNATTLFFIEIPSTSTFYV